jgi:hypothetical protein
VFCIKVALIRGGPEDRQEPKSERVVTSVTLEFEVYDDEELGWTIPTIDPFDLKGTDK